MTTSAPPPSPIPDPSAGPLRRLSPASVPQAPSAATPTRTDSRYVEWVGDRLSARDWAITEAVNRLRVLSSHHLERLLFGRVREGRSRTVTRARALRRLTDWRVLARLDRRVGGTLQGSSVQLFALDSVGHRLLWERQVRGGQRPRVRRPGPPGERTLRHTIAVSELYVRLVELGRSSGLTVAAFTTEPACWWPTGFGGHLKPDAYAQLAGHGAVDHWWIEHDEATESLPTIRRKCETYLDFLRRGQLGPGEIMPRILISAVTTKRRDAIRELVARLPSPAAELFAVEAAGESPQLLADHLKT